MNRIPVVAVVGPTASGKSDLAVEICRRFGGEVVSADSMQIYKGMDIATAKPTEEEKQNIPHHMMNFLDNTEDYSVALYQQAAAACIAEIYSRGLLPVVCGGTGLYVDTLLNNVKLSEDSYDEELRVSLLKRAEDEGADRLLEEVRAFDPEYAEKLHPNNVKRIVRALEVYKTTGTTMTEQNKLSKQTSPYDVCFIGLDAEDRQFLYDRIDRRVDVMLERGLEEEAREYLSSANGSTSAQAIGYKELQPFFDGAITLDEAVENLKKATRRYAKRQLTWFRRNERINWLYIDKYQKRDELMSDAFAIVEKFRKGETSE
ncbi:MAG TPA: tRNA (adenosine(37)-N6)-dimethylallyltransferase MiaA [Ruminococcaceae bacterium]|nr:tRNA (adenosine(37)-N6)-dimethylallyltransferase MiaA [Oscillospiraceae bacterium]